MSINETVKARSMDYAFSSAARLALDVREKRIGCRELLDLYLRRLDAIDPAVNAIVVRDIDRARSRADAADAALARGELWGPLHGLPITVKESYNVAGLATTRGIPHLAGREADRDMLVVERLKAAGAVIFGKSNVPIHLADWQSYNAIYGCTNNPWDLSRTPGGSSGGGAAAVAAGLVAFEAGSDSAGSLRVPAHYCGVYGHRPTHGIVPQVGHELDDAIAPRDLSTLGPIARTADDLALVLGVMAGPDTIDASSSALVLPPMERRGFADLKIAVMLDSPIAHVDTETRTQIRNVAAFLSDRGAQVQEATPALDPEQASLTFLRLLRAAGSAGLTDESAQAAKHFLDGVSPNDSNYRIESARAEVMSHRDWLRADETRHQMRRTWAEFFQSWDFLICPASSTAATHHDHVSKRWEQTIRIDGEVIPATDQMFWVGFSALAHLPSTVAPLGLSGEGLPIGMQVIGPQGHDLRCIAFAAMLERCYRSFAAPPAFA